LNALIPYKCDVFSDDQNICLATGFSKNFWALVEGMGWEDNCES
jgi:hypothetical protein